MKRKRMILVACCENVECMALQTVLAGKAFRVHTVQSKGKIVTAIRHHRPALLVMNIELAEPQDRWDLLREIRREFSSSVSILLLVRSGHGYQYLEPDYRCLYDHALTMPVDLEEVLRGVKMLLGVYPWGENWDPQAARKALQSVKDLSR